MTLKPRTVFLLSILTVPACVDVQSLGDPQATEGGSGTAGSTGGTVATGNDDSAGSAGTEGSGTSGFAGSEETGDATTSSSSTNGGSCEVADEGIEIPNAPYVDEELEAVTCEVSEEGFMCPVGAEPDPVAIDVDAVFAGLAPVPWGLGDRVTLSLREASFFGTDLMVVRDESGELLAVSAGWVKRVDLESFSVELTDIGCGPEQVPNLLATYSLGEESVSILGSAEAMLGGYRVFQESATDSSLVSAGELEEAVFFAMVRVD